MTKLLSHETTANDVAYSGSPKWQINHLILIHSLSLYRDTSILWWWKFRCFCYYSTVQFLARENQFLLSWAVAFMFKSDVGKMKRKCHEIHRKVSDVRLPTACKWASVSNNYYRKIIDNRQKSYVNFFGPKLWQRNSDVHRPKEGKMPLMHSPLLTNC